LSLYPQKNSWIPPEYASMREAEIRILLTNIMRERKISIHQLSVITEVPQDRIRRIFREGSRMLLVEYLAFLKALGQDEDIFQSQEPTLFDPSD
jgi:hypothetical protein